MQMSLTALDGLDVWSWFKKKSVMNCLDGKHNNSHSLKRLVSEVFFFLIKGFNLFLSLLSNQQSNQTF